MNRIEQIGDVIESTVAFLPEGEELTIAIDGIGILCVNLFGCL